MILKGNVVPASSGISKGPLALQTAPQAAAAALREAIISGQLKKGDRILEQKWSTMLGIGQPTLREAMRELEHQGLLRKLHQRGTYVAELSPDDYRQILEVRIPLESMAIGLAAERMTPEQSAELSGIVDEMHETVAENDVRRFHDLDVMFHRKIWEVAGNPYLQDVLETITFRLFVFAIVGRWQDNPDAIGERRDAVRQHVGILKGLKSKDAKKAREAFVDCTVKYWNATYKIGVQG